MEKKLKKLLTLTKKISIIRYMINKKKERITNE